MSRSKAKKRAGPGKLCFQSGQAMTEYLFLIILVALVCIPVAKWLPAAVQGYARPIYYCVSRPIP